MSTFQDNGVILIWDPPVFPQGTIMYYEVAANRSSSNFYQTYRTESNEFNANNNDLPPGMYCIQVCSVCVFVRVRACMYVCHVCVMCCFLLTTGKNCHQCRPRRIFSLSFIQGDSITRYVSLSTVTCVIHSLSFKMKVMVIVITWGQSLEQ